MDLKDKVVLVTGASSGIGRAAAIQYSNEGSRVIIVGRNKQKLQETASQCKESFVTCADLTVESDVKRVIQETITKFGRLDVLVNNAGVIGHKPIVDGDLLNTYDRIMNVNFRAVVHITSLAVPHLIKTKGNIVNISSVAGVASLGIGFSIYSASKAALNIFTTYSASELASYGVRVNTVSPGPVRTNLYNASDISLSADDFKKLTALDRISEPEEVAELVLFLSSEKARGITGSNFVIDNGVLVKV